MIKRIYIRCIELNCHRNKKSTFCSHEEFFRNHAMKKSTERIIQILKTVDVILPFENNLGRYTILNIFTDLCKEPIASKLIRRSYHD